MAQFDLANPTFSLQQFAAAVNNNDGTFGSPVVSPSAKGIKFNQKLISDRAEGNTRITALAAQAISAGFQLDSHGFQFALMQIFMGVNPTSSGPSSPTLQKGLTLKNNRMKYFGVIAQAWSAENDGDVWLFLPKCKITSDFTWGFDFGKIAAPQFKMEAIEDDNFSDGQGGMGCIWNLTEHSTVQNTLAFPPSALIQF